MAICSLRYAFSLLQFIMFIRTSKSAATRIQISIIPFRSSASASVFLTSYTLDTTFFRQSKAPRQSSYISVTLSRTVYNTDTLCSSKCESCNDTSVFSNFLQVSYQWSHCSLENLDHCWLPTASLSVGNKHVCRYWYPCLPSKKLYSDPSHSINNQWNYNHNIFLYPRRSSLPCLLSAFVYSPSRDEYVGDSNRSLQNVVIGGSQFTK